MGICEQDDKKSGVDVVVSKEEDGSLGERQGNNISDQDAGGERNVWEPPKKMGLYDPKQERDACGVGFVVSIDCIASHKVIILFILFILIYL
jgi:hypothetical protein